MVRKLTALLLCGIILLSGCVPDKKDDGSNGAASPGIENITVGILSGDVAGREKEYIKVSGHPDSEIEDALNSDLFLFSTWDDVEDKDYTLGYAVVGNYLSVRRTGIRYKEGDAYPVSFLETQIFDLETGNQAEKAGSIGDFLQIGQELRNFITSGTFKQIHPDGIEIEGAAERLAVEIVDNYDTTYETFEMRFYLTETSIVLYIEVSHAEGDYWACEAAYSDIRPALQKRVKLALGWDPYE